MPTVLFTATVVGPHTAFDAAAYRAAAATLTRVALEHVGVSVNVSMSGGSRRTLQQASFVVSTTIIAVSDVEAAGVQTQLAAAIDAGTLEGLLGLDDGRYLRTTFSAPTVGWIVLFSPPPNTPPPLAPPSVSLIAVGGNGTSMGQSADSANATPTLVIGLIVGVVGLALFIGSAALFRQHLARSTTTVVKAVPIAPPVRAAPPDSDERVTVDLPAGAKLPGLLAPLRLRDALTGQPAEPQPSRHRGRLALRTHVHVQKEKGSSRTQNALTTQPACQDASAWACAYVDDDAASSE